MGLLEGLAGASVCRAGAGEVAEWRPEDRLGVTGSCHSTSCFWHSEVTLEQPQRPACLDVLRDLGWAPASAVGSFLPQTNAENPGSCVSNLSLARCAGRESPRAGVPVNLCFPLLFLS